MMAAREKESGAAFAAAAEAARDQQIWRERVRCEHRSAGRAAPFRIAPREMQQISQGLPLKPTQYDPHDVRNFADVNGDGDISEKEQANFDNALALMKDVAYVPTQKGLFPATEAQEHGWLVGGGGLAALDGWTVDESMASTSLLPPATLTARLRESARRAEGGAPATARATTARGPRAAAAAARPRARGARRRAALDADTLLLTARAAARRWARRQRRRVRARRRPRARGCPTPA